MKHLLKKMRDNAVAKICELEDSIEELEIKIGVIDEMLNEIDEEPKNNETI